MSENDEQDKPNEDKPKAADKEAPDASAELEKWKALARKHEESAKSNATAAKRLAELEDKDKSEVERLTKQIATLTAERDSAVGRADRLEVAVLKALPEENARRITTAAKRLTGTTREELEADADEFIPLLGTASSDGDKPPVVRRPTERLRGGSEPEEEPEEKDVRKIGERMFAQ